jgi:hypothetical protein
MELSPAILVHVGLELAVVLVAGRARIGDLTCDPPVPSQGYSTRWAAAEAAVSR